MPISIVKRLVLFFIFATGYCDKHRHNTIPLFNNNICKSLKDNTANIAKASNIYIYKPLKNRLVYYTCKHSGTRRAYNPYAVVAKDVLRKYIYIVNVVVIYIILYSL
uniref:Uncharacterized protein n=1 Tax=viral metagenome TaxID=1070528 RepID=A0A6C0LKA4_9ZZZZ